MAAFVFHSRTRIMEPQNPAPPEATAVALLRGQLSRMFTGDSPELPDSVIIVGTPASSEAVRAASSTLDLQGLGEDGFVAMPVEAGQRSALMLASVAPKGVLNGTYALLRQLGAGLAGDGPAPEPRPSAELQRPLVDSPCYPFRLLNGPAETLARLMINWTEAPVSMSAVYLRDYPLLQWKEKYDEDIVRTRMSLRSFLREAEGYGIGVLASGVETWYPDGLEELYPEIRHSETGHVCCPESPGYYRFIEARLGELFSDFSRLGGYRLTLADIVKKDPFETCAACSGITPAERVRRIVEAIRRAVGRRLIIVRSWGIEHLDPEELDAALPEDVAIECKAHPAMSPWLERFPRRPRFASLPVNAPEARGNNFIACSMVEAWKTAAFSLMRHGVGGLVGRGRAGSSSEFGDRLASVNAYSFARFAWQPAMTTTAVYSDWCAVNFPGAEAPVTRILRASGPAAEAVLKAIGKRLDYHSGLPPSAGALREVLGELPDSEESIARAFEEKHFAFRAVAEMKRILSEAASSFAPDDFNSLMRMLEHHGELARLFELYVEGLLRYLRVRRFGAGEEEKDRLARVAVRVVAVASAMQDNSSFASTEGKWGRKDCPSLVRVLRENARTLGIGDFLRSVDAPRARALLRAE